MARPGPKPKARRRWQCGRPKPEDAGRVTAEIRALKHGLPMEHARDPLGESAYGRLYLRGELQRHHVQAAERVEKAHARYLRALDLRPLAAVGVEPRTPGVDHSDTSEEDERAVAEWQAIGERLAEYPIVWRALMALVVDRVDVRGYDLLNARVALNSLVKLWKITDGRG